MAGNIASLFFRAKVMKVLRMDLQFKPRLHGVTKLYFRELCKTVRDGGGNEYDAAIFYLLEQLDITQQQWKQKTMLSAEEQTEYLVQKREAIVAIMPRSTGMAEKRLNNIATPDIQSHTHA